MFTALGVIMLSVSIGSVVIVLVIMVINIIDHISSNKRFNANSKITSGKNKVYTNMFFNHQIVECSAVFDLDGLHDVNPYMSFRDVVGASPDGDETMYISTTAPNDSIEVLFSHTMSVSVDINTIKPIRSRFVKVFADKVWIKNTDRLSPVPTEKTIMVSESRIDNFELISNVKLCATKSHFNQIYILDAKDIELSSCQSDATTLKGAPGSILSIYSSNLQTTMIKGPFDSIRLFWSDLSKTDVFNVDGAKISIYGCVGNGTTIKPLVHGKLFVNWTSTTVFLYSGTAQYEFSINDTAELFRQLSDLDDGSTVAFIIDYILDHPAKPFPVRSE